MGHRKLWVVIIKGYQLYLVIIILGVGSGLWLFQQPAIWTSLPFTTAVSGKKIVIDAGHGGGDPGAKSPSGLAEKKINLEVALRLKKYLSRVGVYCTMIRETDRDFFEVPNGSSKKRRDLGYRTRIANESKADIFLSIHGNSFPQSIYRGAQTFFKPNDPLSKKLAIAIQYHLVKELGPNNRRPKPGDFRVLNDITMPGVMIEIGFLSNPEEVRLLSEPRYQEQIAAAIFHGVVTYLCDQVPSFTDFKD